MKAVGQVKHDDKVEADIDLPTTVSCWRGS